MKIPFLRILSAAGAAFVFTGPVFASSPDRGQAARMYAIHGLLYVQAAGPYVERGTYRIQVLAKLGEPSRRLSDGAWLYERQAIESAGLKGTLVVRFHEDGRVQSLALASPETVAALRAADTNARRLAAGR